MECTVVLGAEADVIHTTGVGSRPGRTFRMKRWCGLPYLRKRQLRKILKDVREYVMTPAYEDRVCHEEVYTVTYLERQERQRERATRRYNERHVHFDNPEDGNENEDESCICGIFQLELCCR